MSILAIKSERKAIAVLAKTLRYFGKTMLLSMSAIDEQDAKQAENLIRGIIETNGYKALEKNGQTIIKKTKKN